MSDKSISDEVAALAEAVRELKDREVADELRSLRAEVEKLRAEREAHTCHGHAVCCSHVHCNWGHCGCFTVHGYTFGTVTYPSTWTVTTTNAASGYNPATTTLGLSN